ncbi:MAG TPA: glycosyltransferase family A protein [Polyangiaceae bacterium]|nr:glycosyltransferase family A protein [Polyangiaceae bacterium]
MSHDQPKLRVSVALSTRNRALHTAACVETILRNTGFEELFVVDQSDGTDTEDALAKYRDPRLHYVRTETRGVTNGRNLGAELSSGDIVAYTDDDCRVAGDWVPALTRIFASDPEAAVVCGRVRVAEEVRDLGFTESFEPQVREWKGKYPPFGRDWGITANLAVRKSVLAKVGMFDPMLGAGAPLRSGGEPDFLFRVLRSGFKIVNASEVVVDHLGVRAPGKDSQKLIRGYGAGTGAAFYKHVRMGDLDALGVYLGFLGANVRRVAANVVRGKRPDGLGYLLSFLSGSVASYKFRVDRHQRLYVQR